MNICLISNIYPPYHRGGAEQVVVKTVEGLLEAGHRVVLITATPGQEEIEQKEGLTIHRIHPKNIFFYTNAHEHGFISRLLWHVIDIFNIGVSKQVKKILQEEQPDVVHTHNLMGLSFLIPKTIRRLGLRHIHTVHDVQLVEPSGIIFKEKENSWRYTGLPTKLYTALLKHLMGSPDVVISPSQFLKNFYSSRGFFQDSSFVIVRNPVTVSIPEVNDKTIGETVHFLYIGQIEKHKGIFVLMDAFGMLSEKDVALHIVGSGSELEAIRKQAADDNRIEVHGRVTREQLPGLFSTMSVSVVPSLCYENSPTVIFESLAFGVPVIASDIEGVAELIVEGENGRTFEAGNAKALSDALSWCASHTSDIESMSKKTDQSLVGLSKEEYIGALVGEYTTR